MLKDEAPLNQSSRSSSLAVNDEDDPNATSWTLLDVLGDPSADEARVRAALNELTERYYPAVRNLVRSIGGSTLDANDVTQEFFKVVVIERGLFTKADRDRGHFRQLLARSVRHFVIDYLRRTARDRAGLRPDGDLDGWDAVVPPSERDPDETLVRDWGRTLVAMAIERLKVACQASGEEDLFVLFAGRFLTGQDKLPGWREIGLPLGLDEKRARSRAEVAMGRFRRILRNMIAADPGCSKSVDDEIRALIGSF